jgi:putative membrane protein (TIGR04086 family)
MNSKQMGKGILYGFIAICLLFLFFSFFFSVLIKSTNMTEASLSTVLLITSFVIMFLGGFLSGLKGKEKGWLIGGATGTVFILFLFLIKFLAFSSAFSNSQLLFYAGFIGTCILGSIIGVNLTKNNKQHS